MAIERIARMFPGAGRSFGRRAAAGALGGGLVTALAAPASAWQGDPTCSREAMCQIHGVTGGGVVQTSTGTASMLLFASHFAQAMTVPAFSKYSWKDPNWEDGLDLVNSGPIYYPHGGPDSFERELKGLVKVNGGDEHPFTLLVTSAARIPYAFDTCRITVGDAVSGITGEGWSYEAEGPLIGGELVVIHTDENS